MGMFDEPGDPVPLDEITALRRAVKCIEPISRFLACMAMLVFIPVMLATDAAEWLLAVAVVLPWYLAWVLLFRHWRRWAIRLGCDPEELELLGEEAGIIPPRGSWLWYLQWPAHAP